MNNTSVEQYSKICEKKIVQMKNDHEKPCACQGSDGQILSKVTLSDGNSPYKTSKKGIFEISQTTFCKSNMPIT